MYDFTTEQYFSEIRAPRIVIRGTHGKIINDRCTYLNGNTPVTFDLVREQCGITENPDGMYLRSITGNGKVLYRNPFPGVRFPNEEIAIATCLVKMKEYLQTGINFYSPEQANIDFQTALAWQ